MIGRAATGTLLVLLFCIGTIGLADHARADTTCPIAGTRPATPLDAAVKNGTISVGQCYNPNDPGVGASGEEAKQQLEKFWCGGRAATCGSYTSTMSGLNPKFAQCALKLMNALRAQNSGACIRSAFRSTAHQVCACGGNAGGIPGKCAPAGRSYHQRGLAIDVNHPGINNQTFWQIASQAGLGNPNGLHSSDPDHIQPVSGTLDCTDLGYTPSDTDVYTPAPTSYGPTSNIPTSNGNWTQQPTSSGGSSGGSGTGSTGSGTGSTASTNPQLCIPSNFCSGSTLMSQDSSCNNRVVQICPGGCIGTSCTASTSTTQTSISELLNSSYYSLSTSSSSSQTKNGTSSFDIINSAGSSTQDNSTPTNVSELLNSDLGEIVGIYSDQPNEEEGEEGDLSDTTSSSTERLNPDTFTTSNLDESPVETNYVSQSQASGFMATLSTIKSILLALLSSLGTFNTYQLPGVYQPNFLFSYGI